MADTTGSSDLEIDELRKIALEYDGALRARKEALEPSASFWYPYGTLKNFIHLDELLHGENRHLLHLAAGLPLADIGAADGDLAYFLEQECGMRVHIIDHAPTNFNSLRGARRLKEALGSAVEIHDIDLDQFHELPHESYGLVFFLGILYHLKNPYYALESLARRSRHCVLSTRVARCTPDKRTCFSRLPLAYLLDPMECNNDATNYWIFSEAGLRRILQRAGWEVLEYTSFGDTTHSDPAAPDADERAFCLLRSRTFETAPRRRVPATSPTRRSSAAAPPPVLGTEPPHALVEVEDMRLDVRDYPQRSRDDLLADYWSSHPRFRFVKQAPPAAKMLDVGAGAGGLVHWKTWMEPMREDLELHALDRHKGAFFDLYAGHELCDLEQGPLPYAPESFDALVLSHVLDYLEDAPAVLQKLVPLLRRSGTLYLEVPTPASLELPRRRSFLDAGLKVSTVNLLDDPQHRRTYSIAELAQMLEGHGLSVLEAGVIVLSTVQDELLSYGVHHHDEELTTYALWSKLRFAQYVRAEKRAPSAQHLTRSRASVERVR